MKPNAIGALVIPSKGEHATANEQIESVKKCTVHFAISFGYDAKSVSMPMYLQVGTMGFPGQVYEYGITLKTMSGRVIFRDLPITRASRPMHKMRVWVNPKESLMLSVACPASHKRIVGEKTSYVPALKVIAAAAWANDGVTLENTFGTPA